MTYNWDKIEHGDVVELEHDRGNTLTGKVYMVTDREFSLEGMPFLRCAAWEIKKVTKPLRDGDIGRLYSHGHHFVGIYNEKSKKFKGGTSAVSSNIFDTDEKGIRIIGNVYED